MDTGDLRDNMRHAIKHDKGKDVSAWSGPDETAPGAAAGEELPVSAEYKADPVNRSASAATVDHRSLAGSASFISDTVSVSDDDKAAFMDALVTGRRYERPFSLFGGRITGVFRCRSVAESDGILAWLSACLSNHSIDYKSEYSSMLRSALLAAQVKSLRGSIAEDFPELPEPYAPTRKSDGSSVDDPGWIGLAKAWCGRPEALVTALHTALQEFERVYWTMVSSYADKNFWSPAASI